MSANDNKIAYNKKNKMNVMTSIASDASREAPCTAGFPRWCKALSVALVIGFSQIAQAAPSSLDTQISQIEQAIAGNETQMAELERNLQAYDAKLQETQRQIRSERDNNYRNMHTARRDITRQKFELERIQQAINLIDQQIDLLKTDTDRSIARYESLNTLKRSLEASDHTRKLQDNAKRITSLERDKQPLQEKLGEAKQKFDALISQVPQENAPEINVDDHPAMAALLNQRANDMNQLNKLRQQQRINRATLAQAQEQKRAALARVQAESVAQSTPKSPAKTETVASAAPLSKPLTLDPPPAAGIAPGNKAYVFAISGEVSTSIENILNLKSWVESYGAKYYEAHWNGFTPSNRQDTEQFRREFADHLRQIPPAARIILIGHGRGGGAAIEAATDVAYSMGRTIDFLAVLDPVGENNLRANIVYQNHHCQGPEAGDKTSLNSYIDCISAGTKRAITSNVKHFYNRWQKDGFGPTDYARSYPVMDNKGEIREAASATGRFALADNIQADQKRMFFNDDKDAHMTLLQQESKNLPNLLVKHLR